MVGGQYKVIILSYFKIYSYRSVEKAQQVQTFLRNQIFFI